MSLVGDMFIMICWLLPFYFVPLSFCLPAMMTSLALMCNHHFVFTADLFRRGLLFSHINVGDVFFYWYMPAGYFSAFS